ncbi:MAG: spore coat associated protein CotJA [Clostridia bacterium]|nr:spore coat associated protein CotJA [Clostridia bacterium]
MLPDYIDLAEAFVPIQPYGERFPLAEALEKGTLFVDLYQPYTGRRPYRERGRRM